MNCSSNPCYANEGVDVPSYASEVDCNGVVFVLFIPFGFEWKYVMRVGKFNDLHCAGWDGGCMWLVICIWLLVNIGYMVWGGHGMYMWLSCKRIGVASWKLWRLVVSCHVGLRLQVCRIKYVCWIALLHLAIHKPLICWFMQWESRWGHPSIALFWRNVQFGLG